jgi:enoyl-CoA hydratase
MSEEVIRVARDGRVAILTIDRPKTLNALDIPTILAFETAFAALETDDGVGVIVITGAGERAFVAGGDIADLTSRRGLAHYQEFAEVIHRVFRKVEACDKPTIAAINGWALGGGTELLLATDIRYATETAKLGLPEITLGLIPGAGGTQRMIRQVPLCRARELMFTGDRITAAEAVSIGLINRAVPAAELMAQTLATAHRIAEKSPLVLKLMKRAILHGQDVGLSASLAWEQAMASLVLDTDDAHEGCSAFLESRKPEFKGR